jgi:hypothetical protein
VEVTVARWKEWVEWAAVRGRVEEFAPQRRAPALPRGQPPRAWVRVPYRLLFVFLFLDSGRIFFSWGGWYYGTGAPEP